LGLIEYISGCLDTPGLQPRDLPFVSPGLTLSSPAHKSSSQDQFLSVAISASGPEAPLEQKIVK